MSKNKQKRNLILKKLKLVSGGGLKCDYGEDIIIGDITHYIANNLKLTFEPRPILHESLNNLKPVVVEVLGYTKFLTLVQTKEFMSTPLQKGMTERTLKIIEEGIRITGISLSGEGDKEGVVITYGLTAHNGQLIGGSTPKLFFNVSTHGFEEELENNVAVIIDEMYEYIVNKQYAQLEMDLESVTQDNDSGESEK
jgi:hypothetical protein